MVKRVAVAITISNCDSIYEVVTHGSAWLCRRYGYVYGNGVLYQTCVDWGERFFNCYAYNTACSNGSCTVYAVCEVEDDTLLVPAQDRALYACALAWCYLSSGLYQIGLGIQKFEVS